MYVVMILAITKNHQQHVLRTPILNIKTSDYKTQEFGWTHREKLRKPNQDANSWKIDQLRFEINEND